MSYICIQFRLSTCNCRYSPVYSSSATHLVRAGRLQLEEHGQETVADDRGAQQIRHIYHDKLRAVCIILSRHAEQRDSRHEGDHQSDRHWHNAHRSACDKVFLQEVLYYVRESFLH